MTALDQLETRFAEIVALMPQEFDTHNFILKLAHSNQRLYVQALAQFDSDTPFNELHKQIGRRLAKHSELVTSNGSTTSPDIFGNRGTAEKWRKV